MEVFRSFIINASCEYEALKDSLLEVYGSENFDYILNQVSINPKCINRFDIGNGFYKTDFIVHVYLMDNGYYKIDYTSGD